MARLPTLSHIREYDPRPAYLRDAGHTGRGYAVIMDPPYYAEPMRIRAVRCFARLGVGVICGMILFAVGHALI